MYVYFVTPVIILSNFLSSEKCDKRDTNEKERERERKREREKE